MNLSATGGERGTESRAKLPARYVLFAAVGGVLALGASQASQAHVGRPERADEVLTEVPARTDAEVQALLALQKRAAQSPGDLPAALALAQRYIEASRRNGDPRYLGAAEAALAPFSALSAPPASVRLLRATILQSRHEFDAALRDLDLALAETPDDAQAWLTRATVLSVQGHYDEARRSCQKLEPLVAPSYALACFAPIDALTGHGQAARAALGSALAQTRAPAELAWLHSLAGEQAFWLGDLAASEQHLRAALALDESDRYTRAVHADLLLDAGRAAEARSLLASHESDDALLLRLALVDLAQGQTSSARVTKVEQSFAASRLRGDAVHRREEARFWLARGDAVRALGCALESWTVQHEPWDARLVLESAAAAGRPAEAEPVLRWLRETGFEAPKLRALALTLQATP